MPGLKTDAVNSSSTVSARPPTQSTTVADFTVTGDGPVIVKSEPSGATEAQVIGLLYLTLTPTQPGVSMVIVGGICAEIVKGNESVRSCCPVLKQKPISELLSLPFFT